MKVLVVLAAACFASSQSAYSGYHGPLASPVVNPSGFLADTPEVAAAKAAHFSEVAKVSSPSGYAPGPYNGAQSHYSAPAPAPYNPAPYSAPAPASYNPAPYNAPAVPSHYAGSGVSPQGFLADTPEIAAAKAAHFAEKAKVGTKPYEAYDDGSYKPEYDNPSYSEPAAPAYNGYSSPAPYNAPAYQSYSAPAPQQYAAPSHGSHYSGPLASPVVTPQGFLAETPEVAAAKAAHFAEFSKAGSYSAPAHHGRYRRSAVLVQTPAATAPLAAYVAAPYYSYSAPYSYVHAPAVSGYSYSVRTW